MGDNTFKIGYLLNKLKQYEKSYDDLVRKVDLLLKLNDMEEEIDYEQTNIQKFPLSYFNGGIPTCLFCNKSCLHNDCQDYCLLFKHNKDSERALIYHNHCFESYLTSNKTFENKSIGEYIPIPYKIMIENKGSILKVRKNKFGNYIDFNTNIVFEKNTSKVLGNQLDNGSIGPLTNDQIFICEKNNFIFDRDVNSNLEN
jgi:hypothetical protein